jgi:hypothetical protein
VEFILNYQSYSAFLAGFKPKLKKKYSVKNISDFSYASLTARCSRYTGVLPSSSLESISSASYLGRGLAFLLSDVVVA